MKKNDRIGNERKKLYSLIIIFVIDRNLNNFSFKYNILL